MKSIGLFIAGAVAGIVGGMGLGGGSLLIPILTGIFGIGQKSAQWINLIAFFPMSIFALAVHFRNHRVRLSYTAYIMIPACIFTAFGALSVKILSGKALKRLFGLFLIASSAYNLKGALKSGKSVKDGNFIKNR